MDSWIINEFLRFPMDFLDSQWISWIVNRFRGFHRFPRDFIDFQWIFRDRESLKIRRFPLVSHLQSLKLEDESAMRRHFSSKSLELRGCHMACMAFPISNLWNLKMKVRCERHFSSKSLELRGCHMDCMAFPISNLWNLKMKVRCEGIFHQNPWNFGDVIWLAWHFPSPISETWRWKCDAKAFFIKILGTSGMSYGLHGISHLQSLKLEDASAMRRHFSSKSLELRECDMDCLAFPISNL